MSNKYPKNDFKKRPINSCQRHVDNNKVHNVNFEG